MLERSQKQILLAQHARQVLALLDDTPVVPGEQRAAFAKEEELRHILGNAEDSLKAWTPDWEELPESGAVHTSSAGVPLESASNTAHSGVDAVEAAPSSVKHEEVPASAAETTAPVASTA